MINYKLLLVFPAALLVLSLAYIWINLDNLKLDIDLRGGTQITIESQQSVSQPSIEKALSGRDVKVRVGRGLAGYTINIDAGSTDPKEVMSLLEKAGYSFQSFSVQSVGPALGASFFKQAQLAIGVAFVMMAAVIFIVFRKPLPSFYAVLAAFADIVEAFAVSQLLGIHLSLATFAGLLLLIGYSVDTDILLTTRVLNAEAGQVKEKIRGAMKTGLTMSLTTIAAVTSLILFTPSSVITDIASILLIGIVLDVLNTWVTNAGLLRMYVEGKHEA